MPESSPFDTHAAEYDAWFDRFPNAYESELLAVRCVLPPRRDRWVEVGVGSGRFASRLGIDVGVEPSEAMARLARRRGIDVLAGRAEVLPLDAASAGAVFLITTICFVQDLPLALGETRRILQPDGFVLVAFIPRDSRFGRLYAAQGSENRFFERARLRSVDEVDRRLADAGFEVDRTIQTLTGDPAAADERVEIPSPGSGRGSFVVLRGRAPGSAATSKEA
ncbi:MAG: class I SAM-dependent methyltransferase [Candidatus Bipolaricaulis sp.]|nr:class I SAM-dependent methyltransferase [Candidatus Bipolaricaulis sp.]MDD5646513.1 class I SAM-dependent methyltransferase [Candidatus Bipolaricaulis sp.]